VADLLVLDGAEVELLLDIDRLVEAVGGAMADVSAGRASVPERVAAVVDEKDAFLGAMPAYLPGQATLAAKLVTVFPHNRDLPSHHALVCVFDAETGAPRAAMDGGYLTAARTAAGSRLSVRLLARDDARVLAVLGTGVQARSHLAAMRRERAWDEVRVAGRDPAKAQALAEAVGGVAYGGYEEAVRGADVVCATTHSPEPVVHRAWLSPGAHVTSVGFNPDGREIDGETVRDALVVVESRSAALAPFPAGSSDLLLAIRDGLITPDHVHAEIGELVLGTKPGRTSPEQLTLYKSVGVAAQDAAAAALVLKAAEAR
jgi:ornithine cyclodeaminase